ncbi:MAG: hypothetical protein WC702_02770 [Patescibacteria group bacterium]|jgi:hypothetical protein
MLPAKFLHHSVLDWADKKILRRLPSWILWAILLILGIGILTPDTIPLMDELTLGFIGWRAIIEIRRRKKPDQLEVDRTKAIDV